MNQNIKKTNFNSKSVDKVSNINFNAESAISDTNNSINYIDLESQKLTNF